MEASSLFRSGTFHARVLETAIPFRQRRCVSVQVSLNERETRRNNDTGTELRRARSEADVILKPCTVERKSQFTLKEVVTTGEEEVIDQEETESFGGGIKGNGTNECGGGRDESNENKKLRDYYRELLESDPENPLLLRNYGKFLYEVEGDSEKAEECYGRAVLSSPQDGDVLSLYGNLVWETHREKERADTYFQRAVQASPDNCYVLGSYAHFLWDSEEEEQEQEEERRDDFSPSPPLIETF